MEDYIRHEDQFYILATSPRLDVRTRVLKDGETFAIFDRYGDMQSIGLGEQGIYHEGTRHLSRLEMRIEGRRPLLLGSNVRADDALLVVDLANPDLERGGECALRRNSLHVHRSIFLWKGACHERMRIHSFAQEPHDLALELRFEADFADIFEVRGTRRARRGRRLEGAATRDSVTLAYEGLDGVVRRTRIRFDPEPLELEEGRALFRLRLGAQAEARVDLRIGCREEEEGRGAAVAPGFEPALTEALGSPRARELSHPAVSSSDARLQDWLSRSSADLAMMCTDLPEGPYPFAGVPWFSTVFGRDALVTALEMLVSWPEVARAVLLHLAAHQADREEPLRDAEPGKILHETRKGEMAALGEIPFGRYYGSIDSTPLFVLTAGAYLERTGDLAFARSLLPHVERALEWIDRHGDRDGDGFVEYARATPSGLLQQGWKDSVDSVFHEDGALAEGPIALCEVQAYVYAARLAAARIARALGDEARARALHEQAEALRARFEEAFWLEDLGTYALALDGRKRPCRVRSSNAGHCLFAGIASPERARRVAQDLLAPGSFSGYGIRTLAASQARYNPMSYHNGSVWPHDNALIAMGFMRYGLRREVRRLFEALFDASRHFDLHRLPELFCGFPRRPAEGPTIYPVACAPQAWAAGAVHMLLRASLGLTIDAAERRITFSRASLPEFAPEVRLRRLRVGEAEVDLDLARLGDSVSVRVARREGEVDIIELK